jgi:hypothetical protein
MAGEFYSEISSVNTAIAGGWVQTFAQNEICPFIHLLGYLRWLCVVLGFADAVGECNEQF